MMALRVVLAASALCASTAYSDTTSSITLKDDLSQAKSNQSLAQQLWARNNDACLTRDTTALAEVMRSANERLHAQRGASSSSFSSCRQMLTDVLFINGGCYTGKLTQGELDHARGNWEQDSASCSAQIANPRVSSSEDQSEVEWEAEQRKKGTSEEDIKMMKAIRGL